MEPAMRPMKPLLTVTILAAVSFAGCFGGDEATAAAFNATALNTEKSTYKFDASPSTGEGLAYTWDFGDRSAAGVGKVVEHTYQYLNGRYKVTLTIVDSAKKADTKTEEVQVGQGTNTDPVLYMGADKRLVAPDDPVLFDASQSVDADDDPLFFEWDFNSKLEESEFKNMEDLGFQQYGIYKFGPAPAAQNTSNGGGESGGESGGLTPSGHNWQAELQKAQKRLLEKAGVTTLDGDHGPLPPEPRNDEFDGKINDTSPIQLFAFPNKPATYFVLVRVYDVKGAMAEGFLKIKVAESVPEARKNVTYFADRVFQPGGLIATGQQSPENNVWIYSQHDFNHDYPGVVEAYLNMTPDPSENPGVQETMNIFKCAYQVAQTVCKDSSTKVSGGPPGVVLRYNVTADVAGIDKGGSQLMVQNMENMRMMATFEVVFHQDLNPWVLVETGLFIPH